MTCLILYAGVDGKGNDEGISCIASHVLWHIKEGDGFGKD